MRGIITDRRFTRINFYKFGIWVILGIFIVLFLGDAIAEAEWLYLGVLLVPLFIYLSIKKPFIFPFGIYVLILPLDAVLEKSNSEFLKLAKFLGILTILTLLLKGSLERKFKYPGNTVMWWMLFVMYGILSIVWATNPALSLSSFPTIIGLFILYLVVSSYKIKKREFDTIKWFILLGGFTVSIYLIYISTVFIGDTKRATLMLGEMAANPNRFAFSLLIPASICCEKILTQKKKLARGIYSIILGTIIFCIILTSSRGSMLGIAIMIIIYILSIRKKFSFLTILIIIGIILMSFIPSIFFERWQMDTLESGAGRTRIWHVGLMALEKYWIIGAGMSNYSQAYNEFADYARPDYTRTFIGMNRDAHNIYLKTLVELGIIGFSLLVLGIWKHYQAIRSHITSHFAYYDSNQIMLKAAFCAMLIHSFFLDTIAMKSFWLLLMMIMMYRHINEC